MSNIQIINRNSNLLIDSITVANGFEIEHRSLVKRLQETFRDLESITQDSGGRQRIIYYLTERQVMIVPALCRPTPRTIMFQTQLVDAFIEARKQLASAQVPTTLHEALILAAKLEGERLQLEARKLELETKIETDAPKVAFHDTVTSSEDCITVEQMAKLLSTKAKPVGRNGLFQWLRDNAILQRQGESYNIPYQTFITRGYFQLNEKPIKIGNEVRLKTQPIITPKGQVWLSQKWSEQK